MKFTEEDNVTDWPNCDGLGNELIVVDVAATTVTVTVALLVETQPLASVTVSAYVVVAAGEAVGEQLLALESPAAGDQEQLTPPEPLSGVEEPATIVAVPEATAVGREFTVTVVVAEVAKQPFASVTLTE
jgi:hypothetical protein